ncbi:DUF624 domain-containing protein [Globicatella sanguinis]|uniref:DUF624 domain-containing protein n=1 Tax=Globicatella sanguinis TaxID=13076 RepID=UPI000826FA4D|nr:DUF624 domain-containing protein [Globicatella sanguinis]
MNKLTDLTVKLGNFILNILKLHVLAIIHILRGGVILGLFPAMVSIWDLYFHSFSDDKEPKITQFTKKWQEYFKTANILGFILLALILLISYEILLTLKVLNWPWLSLFLLFIGIILFGIFIYSFASLIRYDLSIKNHFKQAFFLLLCSIPELIAGIIGAALAIAILALFPFLAIFASIPLILFPFAWFSYQAVTKLERNQMNGGS